MMRTNALPRTLRAAGVLGAVVLLGSGCGWTGLNSLPLPGAEGHGDGAYSVTIEMPNVTSLTRNSPVRVNDVNVGSISSITAKDYKAIVTVSLNKDVQLPHNAYAKIGQTSLLGSQHLELSPPPDGKPVGTLRDGDAIPIEHASVYPTTEQTLSALSVVLTDGGLQQFEQISSELNKSLDGRQVQARDVIGQLKTTVQGLDKQRGDIIAAMNGIDRLSRQVREENDILAKALKQMPEALALLDDQKQQLSTALVSLGDLGDKADTVIKASGSDITENIRNLVPILNELASTGRNLTRVMNILVTFPFPQNGIDHFLKGDFANLYIDADLTMPRLEETFLLGTALGNRMSGLEGVVGLGPSSVAANPYSLTVPTDPGLPPPAAQPPPAAPATTTPASGPGAAVPGTSVTTPGGGR